MHSGESMEDDPEDVPFPSCLILGYSDERMIHIAASIDDGMIYPITAYIPARISGKQIGRQVGKNSNEVYEMRETSI